MALLCMDTMEDGALHWLRHRIPNSTWDQFSAELLHRYSSDALMSPFERLATVKQSDSVEVYIDQFLICAAQVPHIFDPHYLGYFLNGLKEEIRVRIRSHDTTDVYGTMTIAREVERDLFNIGLFKPSYPSSNPLPHMGWALRLSLCDPRPSRPSTH